MRAAIETGVGLIAAKLMVGKAGAKRVKNGDGTMKIQAFQTPNSKAGISDMISLLIVHLSELPFTVGVTHCDALHLFDVLVLDG